MKSNADNDISNVDEYYITKDGLHMSEKYQPTPVGQTHINVNLSNQ